MKKSNWITIDTAFGKRLINLDHNRKIKPDDNGKGVVIYDTTGGHEVVRETMANITLRIEGEPTPSKPDTSWIETHHEIVTFIALAESRPIGCKADKIREEGGSGAIWELAEDLTNKFQGIYANAKWGEDGVPEYYDVIEAFCILEIM